MKLFKVILCEKCNMEYKIIWDDEKFQEPLKCASCGSDETETMTSGFMA